MPADEYVRVPQVRVDVVEGATEARDGWRRCQIGDDIQFNSAALQSYCLSNWNPIIYDALLLAAAVELCDRIQKRPSLGWTRQIFLRLPVHKSQIWNDERVSSSLVAALELLTGDRWRIEFRTRRSPAEGPRQGLITMPTGPCVIMPFSDGLDSRAVAGLVEKQLGKQLIRVRLGSKRSTESRKGKKVPFARIPYRVRPRVGRLVETSARSRGFKFTLVSGAAAFLTDAREIIMPESGQGALGSWLVPVGQGYEDYRNHPRFMRLMEEFLRNLLHVSVRFRFPRLWSTKGETLREFAETIDRNNEWRSTWSCWQDSRWTSVDHKRRQCGVCAACMLRRQSVHAAGLSEPADTYLWPHLNAKSFELGSAAGVTKITEAQRQYALAGVLHLEHLAKLRQMTDHSETLNMRVAQLAAAEECSEVEAQDRLFRLLDQHANEWAKFLEHLGSDTFVHRWACFSP